VLVALLLGVPGCITIDLGGSQDRELVETTVMGKRGPKLLLLDIDGEITSSDSASVLGWTLAEGTVARVRDQLDRAHEENDIAALLVRIDSPGGSAAASDAVYQQLLAFKQRSRVPVVAQMMSTAASGGYLVAMAADEVVATRTTVTGSIGVILLGINLSGLMEKIGVENQTLTSGEFKDAGSMLRPMRPEERAQIQSVVDDLYEQFVQVVEQGRPKLAAEQVRALADGRIFSAPQALEAGLIDRIDGLDGTIERLRQKLGAEQIRVVSYHRKREAPSNVYSRSEAPERMQLGGDPLAHVLPRPGFHYLWLPGAR